jgi:hypothetical protein
MRPEDLPRDVQAGIRFGFPLPQRMNDGSLKTFTPPYTPEEQAEVAALISRFSCHEGLPPLGPPPTQPAVSISRTPPRPARVDEIKAGETTTPTTVKEIKPIARPKRQPLSLDALIDRHMPTMIFSKFGNQPLDGCPDHEVWEKFRLALEPSDPNCQAAREYFREGGPNSPRQNPRTLIRKLGDVVEWAIREGLESQDIPILTRAGEPAPPEPDPMLSIPIRSVGGDPKDL